MTGRTSGINPKNGLYIVVEIIEAMMVHTLTKTGGLQLLWVDDCEVTFKDSMIGGMYKPTPLVWG